MRSKIFLRAGAMLLALCSIFLPLTGCGGGGEGPAPASPGAASSPEEEEQTALVPFGVYYLVTSEGKRVGRKVGFTSTGFDVEEEARCRFTVYFHTCFDGKKHYSIYEGDDTSSPLTAKASAEGSDLLFNGSKKIDAKSAFDLVPSKDGKSFKVVDITKGTLCVAADDTGKLVYAKNSEDESNYWTLEPAAPSEDYVFFTSKEGHIVLRVPEKFTTRKSINFNPTLAQLWVDYFEQAYYLEIELTDYIPYDTIVIKAYDHENIVAGVVNDYNVITADVGFMESELTNVAKRYYDSNVVELDFGMLHEMGHMFDSGRGWNFESEAWTDLKLCYVLKRMGEIYPDVTFAATPAGYSAKKYFVYDTMEECLGQHDNEQEGGMTKVYAYFGCAKIFLVIANDIGWEPYVKTFHWFQEENVLESSLERPERFYKFVEKLSDFSGEDIRAKIDEINPKAWGVMDDYFSGRTTEAI